MNDVRRCSNDVVDSEHYVRSRRDIICSSMYYSSHAKCHQSNTDQYWVNWFDFWKTILSNSSNDDRSELFSMEINLTTDSDRTSVDGGLTVTSSSSRFKLTWRMYYVVRNLYTQKRRDRLQSHRRWLISRSLIEEILNINGICLWFRKCPPDSLKISSLILREKILINYFISTWSSCGVKSRIGTTIWISWRYVSISNGSTWKRNRWLDSAPFSYSKSCFFRRLSRDTHGQTSFSNVVRRCLQKSTTRRRDTLLVVSSQNF